ncbi:MAG TPA: tetratricopeptide repeat protein [Mucilaginibacter sp.]
MKRLSLIIVILILAGTSAKAQQTRKTDDGLLLQYYQNQQFKEALSYLKTVYTEPVTDTKELSNMAYTASMAGKLADAETYYQRVYDADTTSLTALYNIAGINMRRGNATRAAFYYEKYILKDSTNFQAYKQLAYISTGKFDVVGQLNYLQKANAIDPTEFDVASDLGDLYIKLDSLPPAEKVFNQALAADSENVYLLQGLLKLYSAQKKWEKTVKSGQQLLQLGDMAITTISKLGIAYYRLKNYECGLETLLTLTEDQQTETTYYYIGVCYKELKDQKNAVLYFNKAAVASISPATATYYNEMADSYESLKQLKTALSTYKKALLYNDDPLTYYYLGALYDSKFKDKRNALKYYKKYINGKPEKWQQGYVNYSRRRIAELSRK